MLISLYRTSYPPNKINKTLINKTDVNGNLINKHDNKYLITPSFALRLDAPSDYIFSFTHLYISEYKRYYFIKNVEMLQNNVFKLDCFLDVLQTYSTIIRQAQVDVIFSNDCNLNFSNTTISKNLYPIIEQKNFSLETPFTENGDIILITEKGNI